MYDQIIEVISKYSDPNVIIYADTHLIELSGDRDIIDELIAKDLVFVISKYQLDEDSDSSD